MINFKGEVAVVTGAGQDACYACAKKFIEEGATVIGIGRTESKLAGAAGELGANYILQHFRRLRSSSLLTIRWHLIIQNQKSFSGSAANMLQGLSHGLLSVVWHYPGICFGYKQLDDGKNLFLRQWSEEPTRRMIWMMSGQIFSLPLGATINMDGTAIYQGVCAIIIASCYGINLTFSQMLTIVITAALSSIGTAGVPGAGMVMLAMVLESDGLPAEGIALVAGVDRIFDMGRTTVNITGDASCAIIVSELQRKRAAKKAR